MSATPYHYENLPMQYTEIFFSITNLKFHWKKYHNFNMFAQNIACGYTLEPPRRGGSIAEAEYPQSMFRNKNKKNRYTPVLLFKSEAQGGILFTDMLS